MPVEDQTLSKVKWTADSRVRTAEEGGVRLQDAQELWPAKFSGPLQPAQCACHDAAAGQLSADGRGSSKLVATT